MTLDELAGVADYMHNRNRALDRIIVFELKKLIDLAKAVKDACKTVQIAQIDSDICFDEQLQRIMLFNFNKLDDLVSNIEQE